MHKIEMTAGQREMLAKAAGIRMEKLQVADLLGSRTAALEGVWVYHINAITALPEGTLPSGDRTPACLSLVGTLLEVDFATKVAKDGGCRLRPSMRFRNDPAYPLEQEMYRRLAAQASAPRATVRTEIKNDLWFLGGAACAPRRSGEGSVAYLPLDDAAAAGVRLGPRIEAPTGPKMTAERAAEIAANWTKPLEL